MAKVSFGLEPVAQMEFPLGSGEIVYASDLPKQGTFRLTPKRRRMFVAAIQNGLITADEFMSKYGITVAELEGKAPTTEEEFQKGAALPVLQIQAVGDIRINFSVRSVWADGLKLELTGYEYMILAYLISRSGTVVTKTALQNYFSARGLNRPSIKYLDVYMRKLRCRLGSRANYIRTVWGLGIVFEEPEPL